MKKKEYNSKSLLWRLSLVLFVFSVSFNLYAQNSTVTGVVVDEAEEPLIGVSVSVVGTSTGTVTDLDGNFKISIKKGASLKFSYMGYADQEIKVVSSKMRVILKEDSKMLDELVVVGYGTMKKRDLSGAISQINADEVMKGNPASSINQALQGKIAGVMVNQNDGAPGGGINIQIRGINSFGSSSQPLYVVDGVPFETGSVPSNGTYESTSVQQGTNALGLINPHDIESVEILKDASATAIYGSRGANGVVLITTKRGKMGKAKVEFTSNFSVSKVRKQIDMLDPYTYANYVNEQ